MNKKISIILPVYNEEKNLEKLNIEITQVMNENYSDWEVIYVDDGSEDNSYQVMKKLNEEHEEVRIIKFRRNFGQSAALAAGFDHAKGEIIITMDSDLQNDPKDIPKLIDKLEKGYDCVSGWRKNRKDPITKRIPSWIQTKLAKKTGPNINDFGCTLKAYTKKAIKNIELYGEGHRYIPAKLHKKGYKVTEIEVNHRPRKHGKTKYGAKRLIKGSLDLTFNIYWNQYSVRPLHFLGSIGTISMSVGFIIGLYRVIMKYIFDVPVLPHIAQLLLSVALILFGLLLILFGFLGEMFTKIYYENKKPYNIIKKRE